MCWNGGEAQRLTWNSRRLALVHQWAARVNAADSRVPKHQWSMMGGGGGRADDHPWREK